MDSVSAGQPADAIIFTNGMPPQGAADTREHERDKALALEGTFHGITLPNEEDVALGTPGCQRCELVPMPMTGGGMLHLRLPHTHTLGKVMALLVDSQWQHSEWQGTISIHVPLHGLAPLLSPIMELLSPPEQHDARALFQPDNQLPQVGDYFEIEALPHFVARVRSAWLLDMLRAKRVRSVFQPIMCYVDATPVVYGYECLMRGEVNGETVLPGPMLEMARRADLLFQLDLAARRAAIMAAALHQIQEKVFTNFVPNSIYNPYSCLDSTVRLVDEMGLAREQVVFEIVEGERLPPIRYLQRIVDYYRDNGFCVALDDVGAGFASLEVLLALKPEYVKLDMGLIRGVHQDAGKALIAHKLIETAQELQLQTVAEGIETPDELAWVQAHGADFMQGYLFARPAAAPPLREGAR